MNQRRGDKQITEQLTERLALDFGIDQQIKHQLLKKVENIKDETSLLLTKPV